MVKKAILGEVLFTGEKVIHDFCMIIQGEKIVAVGKRSEISIPDDVVVIEDYCCTVIPGIIDSHVHVFMDPKRSYKQYMLSDHSFMEFGCIACKNLENLLNQGVVYARDMGAKGQMAYEIKELIQKHIVYGPNLKVCGEALSITGGHGYWMSKECDGSAAYTHAVRQTIKDGADHVKLMVTGGVSTPGQEKAPCEMEFEEIATAVMEAHKKKCKVAVHTHGYTGIKRSIEAGVDSIEHGVYLDDGLLKLMLEKGTYLVPTLSAPHFAVKEGLKTDPNNPEHLESMNIINRHCTIVKKAFDMGVPIAMGTDKGIPGNCFEDALSELVLLAQIGVPPLEVLKMSTRNSAILLDISDTHGTLEPGKTASFLILNANPLDDINNIYSKKSVYKDGEMVFTSR